MQNHLLQIVALLALEPPARCGVAGAHGEKAKVFQAMRPLAATDIVRGQYAGYRDEPQVARDSDVETFCAMRLHIDSWRWSGVPWLLRAGKCLALTACEVLVRLKPPPQQVFADANFEYPVNPNVKPTTAIAAWGDFKGDTTPLEKIGELQPKAIAIMDAVGWK